MMTEFSQTSARNEDHTFNEKQLPDIIKQSRSIKGPLTKYILNTNTLIEGKQPRRERIGTMTKDDEKIHKTILLVGETGTGKSTLINAMVNYLLGVKPNDNIWCEIIETKENQSQSQTVAVTVYDVFAEESPICLIDTPGFGSAKLKLDNSEITETIHELCRSKDGVQEIDAVCLVLSAKTVRLTDRQLEIFDAILSLFGSDVEKNIVMFVTYASRKPYNTIKAIMDANIKCAKNDKGEPVYFMFDNYHCENFMDADILQEFPATWNVLEKSMEEFLFFLHNSKTVSLKLTEAVLKKRKQLTASISNLKDRIQLIELKKNEFEQNKAALQQYEGKKHGMEHFEYEVNEAYKELVPIDSKWWRWTKKATCCKVCLENCHFPNCWWVRDLSWCSVMDSEGKCTVCTKRCDHSKHIKWNRIYMVKTKKVKKTIEPNCAPTLEHLDFLIDRLQETGNNERVQKLKELKRRAEEDKPSGYFWRV